MSYLDPTTWRAATSDEVMQWMSKGPRKIKKGRSTSKIRRSPARRGLRGLLVFRTLLAPLDVYAYLRGRFGDPNGVQSMMIHKIGMVQEDSANMINWDYLLKVDGQNLLITGAGREVHVMIDDQLSDEEWLQFASALKRDFANYATQKSAIVKKMEKWFVFPNRFKALGDRCSELQSDLSDAVKRMRAGLPPRPQGTNKRAGEDWGKRRSKLTNTLVVSSIQLSVLTPILFESFIGLIVAVLLRPDVRKNRRLAESFRRSALDVKIYDLAHRCLGFDRPIDESNKAMRAYWRVVTERNDVIHGNVDPVKDALEIVYFEGKTPFFPDGGDAIENYFQTVIKQYDPEKVLENYMLAYELICEILAHMNEPTRLSIIGLMDDSQPGWDDKRGKFGRLFPDYVATFYLPGTRYDTDLVAPTASAR